MRVLGCARSEIAVREYPNFFAKLLVLMGKREKDRGIQSEVARVEALINLSCKVQKRPV
jgi:hypothetical protein